MEHFSKTQSKGSVPSVTAPKRNRKPPDPRRHAVWQPLSDHEVALAAALEAEAQAQHVKMGKGRSISTA